MAKKNAEIGTDEKVTDIFKNQLLSTDDKDLLGSMPDIDDVEAAPDISDSPLEVRVADEQGKFNMDFEEGKETVQGDNNTGDKNKNSDAFGGDNTNSETTNTTNPKVETEQAGDVKISIPKKNKENISQPNVEPKKQTPPSPDPNKEAFKKAGLNEQPLDGGGGNMGPEDDIFNINPKGSGNGGNGGGGNNGPGIDDDSEIYGGGKGPGQGGGGFAIPPEVMDGNNDAISKWAADMFEMYIIGGLKNRALISEPKWYMDLLEANIRKDFREGFMQDVMQANATLHKAFKLTPQVKQFVKSCFLNILDKYPAVSEALGPEIQALIGLGSVAGQYYKLSGEYKAAYIQLLNNMDERLKLAPKEIAQTVKKEEPKKDDKVK